MPIYEDQINVANGTYYLKGSFETKKEICINRLKANYLNDYEPPKYWIDFINQLLEPDDILTLQEYMGYCLIPTNKAQKMLMILGNDGEGKSRIGLIMNKIFGDNMIFGNIQKLENNNFARADLENKLVMVDDDMKLEALKDTSYIRIISLYQY